MTTATLEPTAGRMLGLHLGIAALVVSGSVGGVYIPSTCEWSCGALSSSADVRLVTYRVDTSIGQREVLVRGDLTRETNADRSAIAELRDLSGLTASQVARLFGVSRRSVNNWIAGKPMAPHHEERLSQLLAIVRGVEGSTSDSRRAALLDSSTGPSIFHQLVQDAPTAEILQVNPLLASEQF